ncbi:MAG: hypothetical protein EAX96_04845 [Candidatus Lokiarchaeota archaeon]|nr:hypothetical protein [Candidatus Lokiarchaeota archaeon]
MQSGGPTALLKVLAGILEDAVQSLQRIEVKIEEHTKIFNQISKRLSDLESKMTNNFDTIRDQGLQNLEENINSQFESLGLQDFDKMEFKLDTLINKLQKGIHILSVQGIIGRIEKLVTIPMGGRPLKTKSESPSQESEQGEQVPESQATTTQQKPSSSQAPPPAEEEKGDSQPHLIKPSSFFGS